MNYLIDTHILIWYLENDKHLNSNYAEIINDKKHQPFVSSISLWEIAIKMSLGKLKISVPFSELESFLFNHGFILQNFDFEDLNTLTKLPFHHGDPFDRLIISQAISKNVPIITNDGKFDFYKNEGLKLL